MDNIKRLIKEVLAKTLLSEGRIDDLKVKYPDHIKIIDRLAIADPSPTKKYLDWMLKQAINDEPVAEIVNLIKKFEKEKQRLQVKDINSYATLADLRNAFEILGTSKGEDKKLAKSGAQVIYAQGSIVVLRVTTKEASCYYGRGTKWCIAATQSHNYFASYVKRGVKFYFIIDKSKDKDDKYHKIAVAMVRTEVKPFTQQNFDATDATFSADILENMVGDDVIKVIHEDCMSSGEMLLYTLSKTDDQELIKKYANDKTCQTVLLENPNTPSEIREKLFNETSDETLHAHISDMLYDEPVSITGPLVTDLINSGRVRSAATALRVFEYGEGFKYTNDLIEAALAANDEGVNYFIARYASEENGVTKQRQNQIFDSGNESIVKGFLDGYARNWDDNPVLSIKLLKAIMSSPELVPEAYFKWIYKGNTDNLFKYIKALQKQLSPDAYEDFVKRTAGVLQDAAFMQDDDWDGNISAIATSEMIAEAAGAIAYYNNLYNKIYDGHLTSGETHDGQPIDFKNYIDFVHWVDEEIKIWESFV